MLDYAYYQDEFHGTLIPEDAFASVMHKACAQVCQLTQGRAGKPLPDELRYRVNAACCAVAEVLYQTAYTQEVSSETVGKWTRTYTANGKTKTQRIREAVKVYLDGTGLLYRGVNA